MLTLSVNRANSDAVNGVCVAVKVAVVIVRGTIATGKDVDGSLSATALLDALKHSTLNKNTRRVHGSTVVWRAPGAGVDVVVLVVVGHRDSLVGIRNQLAQNTDTRDLGIVGHSDTADVVLGRRHFTSAPGAVLVVAERGLGLFAVVVEVVGTGGVVVRLQVVAVHVETVVYDGDSCVLARNTRLPHTGDVDVVAWLDGVEQMPLLIEDGVGDAEGLHDFVHLLDHLRVGRVLASVIGWPMRPRGDSLLPRLPKLLFLRKTDAIEDVGAAKRAFPQLALLQGWLDDIVLNLPGGEDVMAIETAECTLVPQTQAVGNLAGRCRRIQLENIVIVRFVVSRGGSTACEGSKAEENRGKLHDALPKTPRGDVDNAQRRDWRGRGVDN